MTARVAGLLLVTPCCIFGAFSNRSVPLTASELGVRIQNQFQVEYYIMNKTGSVLQTLTSIYNKYENESSNSSDLNRMCCMWSTSNPPDILSETEQVVDIEAAFNIQLSEDDAVELYDLLLGEAAEEIEKIINQKC